MTKDEAILFVIDVLENHVEDPRSGNLIEKTIKLCKEALEQPAQKPVAWIKEVEVLYMKAHKADGIMNWKTNLGLKPEPDDVPLYTHPTQFKTLTNDEIEVIDADCWIYPADESEIFNHYKFARAIEQALKEKNG